MRGWKMELFTLDLSFLGWILLGACTMGILYVWITPYMSATEANFYDEVSAGVRRQNGGYARPDYDDFHSGERPGPF